MAVLQVLADDGRVEQPEVAVHERRHLGPRVHVQEVGAIAVTVERTDALEGDALLVERDAHLPGIWAEDVVEEREHGARRTLNVRWRKRPRFSVAVLAAG